MNLADTTLLEKCSKSYELIYSGNYEQAIEELGDLWPGINVAENAGAITNAGQATLSMIEEHWKSLSEYEIYQSYLRADKFLKNTQDVEDIARLRKCARLMGRKLFGKNIHDADFNLPDVVKAYEARFIEQALKEENGIITRAAKHLGITYQSLASMLKARHKKLINKRKRAASRK